MEAAAVVDVQRHDAALAREPGVDGEHRVLLEDGVVGVDGRAAGLLAEGGEDLRLGDAPLDEKLAERTARPGHRRCHRVPPKQLHLVSVASDVRSIATEPFSSTSSPVSSNPKSPSG